MNSSLQDLYNEIVKSEMKARLRKEHLMQMKTQICDLENQIQEFKSEQSSLQAQILVKVQTVSEEEVNHKWLNRRNSILEEQKSELQQTKDVLVKEAECVIAELNAQREEFCAMAQEFSDSYFVLGNGPMSRRTQAEKDIQTFKDEEQKFNLEIKNLEDARNKLDGFRNTRARLQLEVEELEVKCQELDIVLLEENHQFEELLKEKEAAKINPNEDPEFKRVQLALQRCLQRNQE